MDKTTAAAIVHDARMAAMALDECDYLLGHPAPGVIAQCRREGSNFFTPRIRGIAPSRKPRGEVCGIFGVGDEQVGELGRILLGNS